MDVCSGAIHVVDDVTYDVIALYEEKSLEEIENELSYSKEDIEEAYKEVTSLKEEGLLFTEDIYEDYIKEVKSRKTVVKALCLHIAHDCNLACRYCFTESRFEMRLDKYLKVSRLIKRRTVANEACDAEKVSVNGKPARASYEVKEGDQITLRFGVRTVTVEVLSVQETVRQSDAAALYRQIQ